MVFPGRLSRGCSRCKQRKLKCDEARPSCARCIKYGKPCPGYDGNLVIRHETGKQRGSLAPSASSTTAVTVVPAGRSSSVSSSSSSSSSIHTRGGWSSSQSGAPIMVRQHDPVSTSIRVVPSWEAEALGYFMHQYVLPRTGDCPGHLAFLPRTYLDSPESSCIRTALKASAYLCLAHYSKSKEHQIQAHIWHHHALQGLLAQLKLSQKTTSAETVVTMILLSIYEDMDGRGHQKVNPHLNGLVHILRNSDKSLMHAPFFSWVRQQLLIKSFTADSHVLDPSWTTPSANPNPRLDNFRVIAVRVNYLMTGGRQLFESIKQSMAFPGGKTAMPPAEIRTKLLAAIEEAKSIHGDIDEWIDGLPDFDKWRGVTVDGRSLYVYDSRYLACYWINMFTTVSILVGCMVACYDILLAMTTTAVDLELVTARSRAALKVRPGLAVMHRSIAFAMGSIDGQGRRVARPDSRSAYGCLMVWPMAMLARCRVSEDVEVRDAKAALADISSTMGVDLAHFVLYEWKPPLSLFV